MWQEIICGKVNEFYIVQLNLTWNSSAFYYTSRPSGMSNTGVLYIFTFWLHFYIIGTLGTILYDHRPLQLNEDDYQRVCQIPRRKVLNLLYHAVCGCDMTLIPGVDSLFLDYRVRTLGTCLGFAFVPTKLLNGIQMWKEYYSLQENLWYDLFVQRHFDGYFSFLMILLLHRSLTMRWLLLVVLRPSNDTKFSLFDLACTTPDFYHSASNAMMVFQIMQAIWSFVVGRNCFNSCYESRAPQSGTFVFASCL